MVAIVYTRLSKILPGDLVFNYKWPKPELFQDFLDEHCDQVLKRMALKVASYVFTRFFFLFVLVS